MELEVLVTSLDALLQRATEAGLDRPEAAAVEAFCALVSECGDKGAHAAARVIAARLRSPQALLVLTLLDICMKRCDGSFRAEIDKFRFLNEMIKLVSPKYYGNETAVAVQQMVLELMQSWTAEYPKEAKIKDAFEMLKKQGVVKLNGPTSSKDKKPEQDTPASTPVTKPKTKDVIFGDEEKSKLLQKLLQSKNPDDIQAANRLIKTMVREDERRTEAVCRRFSELQTVHNNVRLLDEMLDQFKPGISSAEDLELINELHTACTRLRPIVFKLAADTQQNEEMLNLDMGSEGPKRLDKFWFLAKQFDEVLEASDELTQVTEKYDKLMVQRKPVNLKSRSSRSEDDSTLLDLMSSGTSANNGQSSSTVNELSELLCTTFSGQPNELLTADFTDTSSILDTITVLQPITLNNAQTENNTSQKETNEKSKNKGMAELDALGQDLLKQSTSSFNKIPGFIDKSNSNLPLNQIIKSQLSESKSDELNGILNNDKSNEKLLDINFLLSKTSLNEEKLNIQTDDVMVDILTDNITNEAIPNEKTNNENSLPISTPVESLPSPTSSSDFKNLSNIVIALEEIKPSPITPKVIYEEPEGLKIVLHFTKNKPRPDISVLVISTTSHSSEKIEDFKFQATVPKPCKTHLLPASGNCFPAMNPFLPPAAITQVALVAIPQGFSAKIVFKFFISYTMQDDSFSEMGEVHDLSL